MSIKMLVMAIVIFTCVQSLIGSQNESVIDGANASNNEVLLIFLDDVESDAIKTAGAKIGIITNKFLTAFSQEAGPIIVSASVIDNARLKQKPDETDVEKLIERYDKLVSNVNALNSAEAQEMKNIIRSFVSFDKKSAERWIIKKISAELYLLIPKIYLTEVDIAVDAVALYTEKSPITQVEQQLGLKVNHLETVTNSDTIKKPLPEPYVATYFMRALWDTANNNSRIFVTNREYYTLGNKKDILSWSVYIAGHGTMGEVVAGLSLAQFKEFLDFLEQRIRTRLLYYWSCYAAGSTAQAIYADTQSGVEKTYAFPIITQAITDAPVMGMLMRVTSQNGIPQIMYPERYDTFIDLVTTPGVIDFKKVTACFFEREFMGAAGGMLPQIKLPGLPWFLVIHEERFCSIGSILAQSRTRQLNIEKFFARKGKKAAPMAILLYSRDIPFELVIDSKTAIDMPPTMISMIPGDAAHHIKKISSSVHGTEDLIKSFMQIESLEPNKIFVIDEIASKTKCGSEIVRDIVIQLTPEQNSVYYRHNGQLFKNMQRTIEKDDSARYEQLRSSIP